MDENPLNSVILNGTCLLKGWLLKLNIGFIISFIFIFLLSYSPCQNFSKKKKKVITLSFLSFLLPDVNDLTSTYELIF